MVLVAMAVIVESVEMMLIVVMHMFVMMKIKAVLGALTESPIHPDLATHCLAPSIPAPPSTHKRPVP
jgi:hypothetical protein